jgi:hypothetical protein
LGRGEKIGVKLFAMKSLLSILFLLLVPAVAVAADCKETRFGECYQVHARYDIYADGDALWPVGTKRFLDATDGNLDGRLENAGWQDHSIFGDFMICPQSKQIHGHMQSVCIQSYKNLRLAKRN